MNRYISWNNQRRDKKYWIGTGILLFTAINISVWINMDEGAAAVIREVLEEFYGKIFPELLSVGIGAILFALFTFLAGEAVTVILLNHLIGMMPDAGSEGKNRMYRFAYKTSFWGDVLIGLSLELAAVKGLIQMSGSFESTSVVWWLYILFFVWGSVLYWKSVLPVTQYYKTQSLLKADKEYEDLVWYCISNGRESFSTFERVPWKGKISEMIVDQRDLETLNTGMKIEAFVYYLICIDSNEEIHENFMSQLYSVLNIPHSRLLVFNFGCGGKAEAVKYLITVLSEYKNVRIEELPELELDSRTDIEGLISKQSFRKKRNVRMPLRFIKNEQLVQTYLDIGKGPFLCRQFLRLILNDLEILPGIYAVFDFIDLQYRMVIAYEYGSDEKWMKGHGKVIGNIMAMGKKLEESVIKKNFQQGNVRISFDQIFSQIITDEEMAVIRKYLPNYTPDRNYPVYSTIIYLTTSLRNVLRGHGSFEQVDANVLFELVFKLALMNLMLLSVNNITLEIENSFVWPDKKYRKVSGIKKFHGRRNMSPFLTASETGNILIFNNWYEASSENKKEIVEYINYLDGTLILPEFSGIEVEKKA